MKDLGGAGFSETCTETAMQINMAGTSKTYVKSERLVEVNRGITIYLMSLQNGSQAKVLIFKVT